MSGRYYRALSMMHQRVQEEIEDVERSPQPDLVRISELKRLKLSIKDQMKGILKDGPEGQPERSLARDVRRQSQPASFSRNA